MIKKKDVRDHEDEDENDELQTIYTFKNILHKAYLIGGGIRKC